MRLGASGSAGGCSQCLTKADRRPACWQEQPKQHQQLQGALQAFVL
jgi:hypothetical protein